MKALVIGRNRYATEQLNSFCSTVILAFDNSFEFQRHFPEFDKYLILHSKVDITTPWGILRKTKEILKWQKQYDFNLIYTNTKWDMLAAKLASLFFKRKVVLVSTNHNSYAWMNSRSVKLMSCLIKWSVDIYIPLASFVYNQLYSNGISNKKLLLLPNTIDGKSWEYKESYQIHDTIRIVYVAYVYPAKNQDFIIKVLNELSDKYCIEVDCYGDLDGYPDYVNDLKYAAESLSTRNRFNLCGRVENIRLRSILKTYDLYLCPSKLEMSPVNILEAQAAALPILAANVGGVCDIIEEYKTGLLYEPENINDACEKLITLFEDAELRARLGANARRYVISEYTPSIAGNQLKRKIDTLNS